MNKAMTLLEMLVGLMEELDLVSVVRCKGCKWHNAEEEWCMEHSTFMREDDYCSYGERGEADENKKGD